MSTRWFFSSARVGAMAAAAGGQTLPTSVRFTQDVNGKKVPVDAPGPGLRLIGPGDVTGFDRAMVQREEPPPGTPDAAENVMASVDLTHADLPWLLSPGQVTPPFGADPVPLPWLVLVVLEASEAAPPRGAAPLPVLTAPLAALPPLAESWAWAHVEARLADGVVDREVARQAATAGVRAQSANVVGRLLCPRQLLPDRGWVAAVVPATLAGVQAGRGLAVTARPGEAAWAAGGAGTIELPVYHWWSFRTGAAGTFEELARKLEFTKAADAGLGTRTIDASRPWPAEDPTGPVTTVLDGALRVPGSAGPETWSDPMLRQRFRDLLRERLDQPARRRESPGEESDRDIAAVGPPLYGSHHTGEQTVPADERSWLTTLNLEVRRRVAAALGARYVQLEQEFLMARAWEQAGEIRAANRLLAATELAAAAADRAQRKHFDPLPVSDLVTAFAPARNRLRLTMGGSELLADPMTLATALATADPGVPGVASTAFARLTRRGGALARRAGRIGATQETPVIEHRLEAKNLDMSSETGLPRTVSAVVTPVPLQLRRMSGRIPAATMTGRQESERRPLRPIMAHPRFTVPIAEEILARWPEWAIPGIGGLPPNSVTLLETNPEFVAALLVGLNHEFNRELLWREFPTDQRGTPFARFWPTDGDDVDEIARWPVDAPLGSQVRTGAGTLALLVRGELLRRFPGTALLAVRGENGKLPKAFGGTPATPLPLDESTTLYLVAGLTADRAIAEDWFLVFREPMHGTQFGYDGGSGAVAKWADLTWVAVEQDAGRHVSVAHVPATLTDPPGDPAVWGSGPADMARIAFQQPFQLAFRAAALLRT